MGILEKELVPFKRKAYEQGGSITVIIPPELIDFLELRGGVEVCLAGDKSKHGNFIAIWNPEQQQKEKRAK